jgi:hypothetical protein
VGGDDAGAVAVGDALDLRAEVLVRDHGHARLERGAVRAPLHAVPSEVLGAAVPRQDLREHARLLRVEVLGLLLDELQLLRVALARRHPQRRHPPLRRRRRRRLSRSHARKQELINGTVRGFNFLRLASYLSSAQPRALCLLWWWLLLFLAGLQLSLSRFQLRVEDAVAGAGIYSAPGAPPAQGDGRHARRGAASPAGSGWPTRASLPAPVGSTWARAVRHVGRAMGLAAGAPGRRHRG